MNFTKTERKINLLLLEQYSSIGGAEIVALNFLDALRHQMDMHCILPQEGKLSQALLDKGCIINYFEIPPIRSAVSERRKALSYIEKYIDEFKIDLIYTPMIRCGYFGSIVAKRKSIPFIWHLNEIISRLKTLFLNRYLKEKHTYPIAVSSEVQRHFRKDILVIENPIFTKIQYNSEKDPQKMGFIGRIVPQKGLHLALLVFSRIVRDMPSAEFLIYGEEENVGDLHMKKIIKAARECGFKMSFASYRELLDALIIREDLSDKVRFNGYSEDLDEVLSGIGTLFIPSWNFPGEAFGLTAVEGMRSGALVVSSRSGNLKNLIVHGETGLLSDFKDLDRTAMNILDVLTDNKRYKDISENAATYAKRFDIDLFNKSVRKFINGIIE
ncbi:glycosyltransferase family 4 protein [bacterium]|nr:glycosyltransferase family 4 protein [bacterium]